MDEGAREMDACGIGSANPVLDAALVRCLWSAVRWIELGALFHWISEHPGYTAAIVLAVVVAQLIAGHTGDP